MLENFNCSADKQACQSDCRGDRIHEPLNSIGYYPPPLSLMNCA